MNLADFAIAVSVAGLAGVATIPFIPVLTARWDEAQAARRASRLMAAERHPSSRLRLGSPTAWVWTVTTVHPVTPPPPVDPLESLWARLGPELQAVLTNGLDDPPSETG